MTRQRNVKKSSAVKPSVHREQTQARAELLNADVDWITVSARDADKKARLEEIGLAHLHIQKGWGEKMAPWNFKGYEGFSCGEVCYATRMEDSLLRFSGPSAAAYWRNAYENADNCSRIDIQCTFRLLDGVPQCVRSAYAEAMAHFETWAKKPEVDLWQSNNGSDTLYLNKRISDQFGRVYDKGVESKLDHYQNCVRFEVEYKGKAGCLVAHKLSSETNVSGRIHSLCSGFFKARGVSLPWTAATVHQLSVPRRRSTDTRRLQWFANDIRPSVEGLISRGKLREVIETLGLSDYVLIPEVGPDGL